MPDNKPITPEEFANHVWTASLNFEVNKEQSIKWLVDFVTARDESIRREAKREMREAAAKVLDNEVQAHMARNLPHSFCEDYGHDSLIDFAHQIRILPIDTPPAADRAPEAEYGRSKSNDKRLRALGKPEAVCPRCEGNKMIDIGDKYAPCPNCGTGKRAPDAGKRGDHEG